MRKLFLYIVIIASLSGCAVTAPETKLLPRGALGALAHQNIGHTVRPLPNYFARDTFRQSQQGAVGALLAGSGEKFVVENGIVDPSQAIAADLAGALASSGGSLVVPQPVSVSADEVAQVATAARPTARYIVDVKTTYWGYVYIPSKPDLLRIGYRATAQLIDTATSTVLAQGYCDQDPQDSSNEHTYKQLTADRAALLKTTFADYSRSCVQTLKRGMLGLDGTGEKPATVVASAAPVIPQAQLPAPSNEVPVPGAEQWSGVMACGPLLTPGRSSRPYEVIFAMEVNDTDVVVHRKSAHVIENLSGKRTNGELELRGVGEAIDDPAKHWRFELRGRFEPGARIYIAKGHRIANGVRTRECELKMMRT